MKKFTVSFESGGGITTISQEAFNNNEAILRVKKRFPHATNFKVVKSGLV